MISIELFPLCLNITWKSFGSCTFASIIFPTLWNESENFPALHSHIWSKAFCTQNMPLNCTPLGHWQTFNFSLKIHSFLLFAFGMHQTIFRSDENYFQGHPTEIGKIWRWMESYQRPVLIVFAAKWPLGFWKYRPCWPCNPIHLLLVWARPESFPQTRWKIDRAWHYHSWFSPHLIHGHHHNTK